MSRYQRSIGFRIYSYSFISAGGSKMFFYFPLVFAALFVVLLVLWYWKYLSFSRRMKGFPQMKQWPIVGGGLEFPSTTVFCARLLELRNELGKSFWTMLGTEPILFTADPMLIKVILSSQVHLNKSKIYTFFQNWLGEGLLLSSGDKWKSRRRILTPAFHFKILEEFAETLNGCSDVLVEKLSENLGQASVDIYPYVNLCTLDVICETAMGIRVNAQLKANTNYVEHVNEMTGIPFLRSFRAIENSNLTYIFTRNYRRERMILRHLHNFTNSVIRQRQKMFLEEKEFENGKKKLAFLDLLLSYSANGERFSEEDIREEVDTFMFEGHDTSSSAIGFTLFVLANNPKQQEKAFSEIKNIFSDDPKRPANFRDFQEMKYLELVIKEAFRMYPPVPLFGRQLKQDLDQDGFFLPKGMTIFILPIVMHRDPELYPEPMVFKPERFLDSQTLEKNPFEFVPFSAGPRNCIGQKFAMLAIKSTISKVLRNFELLPVQHEPILAMESTLKSKNGLPVRLTKRKW